MKVFLTLLILVLSINAYVYHRERAVELASDADGNGFLCYVQTTGKDDTNGTAYIRKYLLPPKSGSAPLVRYEDVPVGVTGAKGCTIATYNVNGQMYLLAAFESTMITSMSMMYVPYTADENGVPQFGAFNYWTLTQDSTPFSFSGLYTMPQLLVLNNSIFLFIMGMDVKVSDFRVCYYYYSSFEDFTVNSYKLIDTPATSIYGYKYGNQDYYSAYIQNGVIKVAIAQNRYPFGTCAVATCITGLVYHEVNSLGQITNSTFKTLSGLNLGADLSRPMPGETYHNATTDPWGGVFSTFLSYSSYLFTYSCSWNRTENRCYWKASDVVLTQTAPVIANDATIYNDNWYVVFIDAGWVPKLYTMPTYWTALSPINYYSPRTLLIGNNSVLPIQLSPDYFDRSEFSLYHFNSVVGTKIYLTYINNNFDADIYPIL